MTGKPSTLPGNLVTLRSLYHFLWAKQDSVHDDIFRTIELPLFNPKSDTDADTNPQETRDTWTAKILSLSSISGGPQFPATCCLPCGAGELLIREAYQEMYGILVKHQEVRLKNLQAGDPSHDDKICLILGQPGIGKTWFLSYVLVRRLLEGKPTIFQVNGDAVDFVDATHYLIDENGVNQMESFALTELRMDPEIWALADQKPVGPPRRVINHNWLVVMTSAPLEENYRRLVKEFSPETFYLPAWDWEEILAAA
jgi:hypothetical protein